MTASSSSAARSPGGIQTSLVVSGFGLALGLFIMNVLVIRDQKMCLKKVNEVSNVSNIANYTHRDLNDTTRDRYAVE
jgi:hypothetical protein